MLFLTALSYSGLIYTFSQQKGEKEMRFKDQQLETGDFVMFETDIFPLLEFQAVVIDIKNGVLEVMSTLLAPFQHSGKFTEAEVDRIRVVYPAEVAITQESGFRRYQRVSVVFQGCEEHQGEVVAAFDGVVVARKGDGQLITGGASHFSAVD